LACLLLTEPAAHAQDLFGRTEPRYDLTGSPRIRHPLDYAYITGEVPTYAEQRGLAGLPTIDVRTNYVYIEDTDGTLTIPFQSEQDLFEAFNFALRELYNAFPDEFIFVYLFTSFDTNVGAFFYTPEANDVRGIGTPRHDSNGFSIREGFVFMNYWKFFELSFQGAPEVVIRAQARSVFNQEAGHRWLAFTSAGADGGGSGTDVMLGRDDGHWSYFAGSNGSPMEGNAWRDNLNGTFTTATTFENWHYSDLDLYLMGLIEAGDVADWFVVTNPDVQGQRDIFGQPITRASPPQIIQPVTIRGTRVQMSIGDIQAQHGVRDPSAGASPKSWRSVFVMLASRGSPLVESDRSSFGEMVDDYALGFKQGSRNLGELDYLLMSDPKSPIGGPCETADDCNALEANLCLAAGQPPVGLCTRPCSSPASCPATWCCDSLSGSDVCLPEAMCTPEPPPCACDVTMGACDEGCTCDALCTTGCTCDTGDGCQEGCACDPHCTAPVPCTCDKTFACDDDDDGFECACDPECKTLERDRPGCGCSSVDRGSSLGAMLGAGLLLVALGRQRRATSRR
jgi:hypothetical protein